MHLFCQLERAFMNSYIDEKVYLLNTTLLNGFHNYTPNKIIRCR